MIPQISSPCQKVCDLDSNGQICKTCKRRIEEIVRWGQMSEAERQAIMAQLPSRDLSQQSNPS
jgi:predicted Fe-S protein YdhL (DUF1289 family)